MNMQWKRQVKTAMAYCSVGDYEWGIWLSVLLVTVKVSAKWLSISLYESHVKEKDYQFKMLHGHILQYLISNVFNNTFDIKILQDMIMQKYDEHR